MEELSEIVRTLELGCPPDDIIDYEYISVFKNPNNLPINQIHLEKISIEMRKDVNLENIKSNNDIESKFFERKSAVIPALHKSWLPEGQFYFKFEPYSFTSGKEENSQFCRKNYKFLQTLNYLLTCNFHQFWCSVLFEQEVVQSLHSFLSAPILSYQFECLDTESLEIYLVVFNQFLNVYFRLITFKESPSEYINEQNGLKYLLEHKLLTLPIVITLSLLYEDVDIKFVNELNSLYFQDESKFRDKELDEMLSHLLMTLEMIGGHICGFEKDSVIVPIAIEPRPKVFSLTWVYSVVNYLINIVASLNVLLKYQKYVTELALDKGIPYRLSFMYERVFYSLYDMLWGRKEVEAEPQLAAIIYHEIATARSEFINCFNSFVTYSFDKVLEHRDQLHKEAYIEMYLKLMTSALEDEYFICDYHEFYDVKLQNEMFASCTEIDETRTDYIVNCITSFRRHNRLWKTLKCEKTTLKKAIQKYANRQDVKEGFWEIETVTPMPKIDNHYEAATTKPSDVQIEDMIRNVIDMFPHLGDGFVLKCLETYNYHVDDVISAILEENLPPHILDIPFDEIRIPPEPEPEQPIAAYRHKKPDYQDALELLNDKKDIKQIKTFITEGLAYSNELYDDEYDDRQDEDTVPVRDQGSDDIPRFNPNYDEAVSDTSYSENEYDEEGGVISADKTKEVDNKRAPGNKGDFCEDPAIIRARREAKFRARQGQNQGQASSKGRDVVGKAKGQGQEKGVLLNRAKKNVNKSSRANHNRKSGAQFKRNKGMLPS